MTTRREVLGSLLMVAAGGMLPSPLFADTKADTALARVKAAHALALTVDETRGTRYVSTFRRVLAGDITAGAPRMHGTGDQDFEAAWNNPEFVREFNTVIDKALKDGTVSISIVGGVPDNDHQDCVAVKTSRGWNASGVLVSDRVVLTAAHVYRDTANTIWVGSKIDEKGKAYSLDPHSAERHRGDSDLAILVLAEGERVENPDLKKRGDATFTNSIKDVLAVGYGSTQADGAGFARERLYALLVNGPNPCTAEQSSMDCKPKIEFISGGASKDTCNGDSGGGAYWEKTLVGITSRRVKVDGVQCGLGGVFVRVAEHKDWIDEMIENYK